MKFMPSEEFSFWEEDRLVAKYIPGLSYTVRPGNERLRTLVVGGPLPGDKPVYIERQNQETRAIETVEILPGAECPGWANQGLVVITDISSGGGVSGVAEVKGA